jgi:membrane protein implicated in regulation of membrane protease activity
MDTLIGFLEGLTIWHWWGLAAGLLTLELLTGTTYILWPTAAAALVGLLSGGGPLSLGWEVQLVAFAAVTTVLTLAGDKFVAKRWLNTERPKLNERALQLAGEKVIALADFEAGQGRVKLGDTVWAAVLAEQTAASKGAVLEIVGVDGATLRVKATSS